MAVLYVLDTGFECGYGPCQQLLEELVGVELQRSPGGLELGFGQVDENLEL